MRSVSVRSVASLRKPAVAAVVGLLLVVLTGLASGARPSASHRGPSTAEQPLPGALAAGTAADPELTATGVSVGEGDTGRLSLSRSLVIVGLVVAIALFIRGRFPVPPDDSVPDPSVAPEPLPAGRAGSVDQETLRQEALRTMEEALTVLGDEREPGRAVRLAYAELSSGFGWAALRRQASESELEYLVRMLGHVGGSGQPVRRLTELFTVARFSTEPVTEAMRGEARTALGEIRDDLGVGGGRSRPTAR